MRQTLNPQPPLGAIPIENLTFNPQSRDDTEGLCYALQALWCDAETRDKVLDLIRKSHSERVNGAHGRPGMDVWQILVFAVMKPGLDIDFDRLANLASNHRDLRSLAGLSPVLDPSPMSAPTLANTMSLLTDDVLARINPAIVRLGHRAVGHAMDAGLQARGDSFVVETDVEYPTDLRLLWDAIRAAIQQQVRVCKLLGVAGWRQAKHWLKALKTAWQKASRIRRHHTLYETTIRAYLKRVDHLIVKLTDMRIALDHTYAGFLLEKSDEYVGSAHRLRDQVERRLLKGETIPQKDKIVSVFEPHTRWIAKGKAGTPVELGVPVCVIEDQHQFILGHQILWEGGDRDVIVSCIRTLQDHDPM